MNAFQSHLKQHGITDLRSIEDQNFLRQIASRGRKNVSVLPISVEQTTGIAEYRVVLNQFSLRIRVLHLLLEATPIETESSILGTGGFGCVRACEWESRYIAVKRQQFYVQNNFFNHLKFIQQVGEETFRRNSFCSQFRDYLIELSIAKLCSAFQIGSAVITDFDFDGVCYNDCFEFFLELCEVARPVTRQEYERLESDVRSCLGLLHKELKMTHCDLKPLNIMFSPAYSKYVLIDFGSAEIVDECFVVYTTFRGTKGYWSQEMKKLYKRVNRQPNWANVDLEENDYACLEKSLDDFQRNQDPSEDEPENIVRYTQPRKVYNEFSLFNLLHLLRACKFQRDVQVIQYRVDIVATLTYCLSNDCFMEVVDWVYEKLSQFGRAPNLDMNLNSVYCFLQWQKRKKKGPEADLERTYFEYIIGLRFEGFTRRLKLVAAKLRQHPRYAALIPHVPDEQMERAIALYQKNSTMISFDSNNRLKLKGCYVFSTVSRDLADIEQTEFNLRLELKNGPLPREAVSMRLFHLLFLKFNSLFGFEDKLRTLTEMELLDVKRKQECLLLGLFKTVYTFNFDKRKSELVVLNESLLQLRILQHCDPYYFCLALEQVSKIYEMLGNCEQAEMLLNESIGLFMDRYKNEYHSIMEVRYFRLAELKLSYGCYELAKELYQKILEINRKLNRTKNSLSAVMLRSKLCLYERSTSELPEAIEEVRQQLREHFSQSHPCIMRLNTALLLRKRMPMGAKESALKSLLTQFLESMKIPDEQQYVLYCERSKAQYGSVRQQEVFKLIICGLYEISLEKSEFRRAQTYLNMMISVESGLLLQYYLPLTKLKITMMDLIGAKDCLERSQELLRSEKYPSTSYYHTALKCLEARFSVVFEYDCNKAKEILDSLMTDKVETTPEGIELLEARIWLAKTYAVQKEYEKALEMIEEARDYEEKRQYPRAAVLAEFEFEIIEIYMILRKNYRPIAFHLNLANERLLEEYGDQYRFHFRYLLLLEAKSQYYYKLDIDEARNKAKQCLKFFLAFGKARAELCAVYFLLSKIEQSCGYYRSSAEYCSKAMRIALELHRDTHPNVQHCFIRASQLFDSLYKRKKELYGTYDFRHISSEMYNNLREGMCTSLSNTNNTTQACSKPTNGLFTNAYAFTGSAADSQDPNSFRLSAFQSFMRATVQRVGDFNDLTYMELIRVEKRVLWLLMRNTWKFKGFTKTYYHQLESLFRLTVYYSNKGIDESGLQYLYASRFIELAPEKHRGALEQLMDVLLPYC